MSFEAPQNRDVKAHELCLMGVCICIAERTHNDCSAVSALMDAGRVPTSFPSFHFLQTKTHETLFLQEKSKIASMEHATYVKNVTLWSEKAHGKAECC